MKVNRVINKAIKFIGLICISILVILIYSCNVKLGSGEYIEIFKNNLLIALLLIAIFFTILLLLDKINDIKISRRNKIILFTILLTFYLIGQIVWINIRRSYPIYDQYEVYNDAKLIANGNIDKLINNEYLENCPHQIPLITFYSIIFKICGTTNVLILQYINAIANTFSIIGLYHIAKLISDKKNSLNSFSIIFLSLAFIPLSMLSTFVYGDLLGLAFAIFSIYFIIKYSKLQKLRYLFISAILISLSYYCRTNMLIFFIALVIYLCLDCIKFISFIKENSDYTRKNKVLKILFKILLILLFVCISIIPTNAVKAYMEVKLQLDANEKFPTIGYINHGISNEGYRGPGWYVDKYIDEWKENGHNNEVLKQRAINIIKDYLNNPIKCFYFFRSKIASMWVETTFESIWHNTGYMDINKENITEKEILISKNLNDLLVKNYIFFMVFGKIILIIIYTSVMIFIFRNKELTNEKILLILIFLGGFAFHFFWEGKSRYVLPYVVILIPLASIGIKENIRWIKDILNKIKGKFYKSNKNMVK